MEWDSKAKFIEQEYRAPREEGGDAPSRVTLRASKFRDCHELFGGTLLSSQGFGHICVHLWLMSLVLMVLGFYFLTS